MSANPALVQQLSTCKAQGMTPEMSEALANAYPAPQTATALTQGCRTLGIGGTGCGQQLILMFPSLTFNTLASAMAQGGYACADTCNGLRAAFPGITPTEMSQALAVAYP